MKMECWSTYPVLVDVLLGEAVGDGHQAGGRLDGEVHGGRVVPDDVVRHGPERRILNTKSPLQIETFLA